MNHWSKRERVRRSAGRALRVALIYLFLLTLAPAALAQDVSPASPAAPNADDGALEVGVWYVNDYENCGGWGLGDLGVTDDDALSLRSRLISNPFFLFFNPTPPWSAPLTWGNTLAWQKDWTRGAVGGWDDSQADAVDFAYFAGHGASSGWFFGVGGNNKNGCQVTKNDTSLAMGTNDAEWYGISACNVLDDPYANLQGWANSMNGLRLMMGMKTVMSDVNYGNYVGWYLRWGYNFTQAWFWSADALLPSSQVARILAEENAYFYDTWAQHQAPAFVDNDFYWWTHQAGTSLSAASPAALTSNLGQLEGEMPIYQVVPIATAAEARSRYDNLTSSFGVTTSPPITAVTAADVFGPQGGSSGIYYAPDGSVLMDASGGNYLVVNGDDLMNDTSAQAASGQAIRAITPEEALAAAEQFLNTEELMLSDAAAPTVVADVITSAQDSARHSVNAANGGSTLEVTGESPENYQVSFSRQLQFVPFDDTVASGVGGGVTFDVVGPGPKLTVYVDATSPATATVASIAEEGVLGGQGGWRAVQDPQVLAASGQQVMVSMLPTTTIETLFNQLEEQVSLDSIPLPAETKEILNITAGYYEGPIGMNMDQLIPVYILTVKGTLGDGSEQTYNVFIPVNPSYMPPLARIDSPTTGSAISGNTVHLVAADAKKMLSDLGYDASLTFSLGTANDDASAVYNYDWYLNDTSNHIGSGMTLDYQVPAGLAPQEGKPFTAKFILVVTDVEKTSDPRTASDQTTLTVNPIYLPTVIK